MMARSLLRYLAFFGPEKPTADLTFTKGLNIICGASETGKSFVVEAVDFMLGREHLPEIAERQGYDRVRLAIETTDWPPLTLDRSVEGGDFLGYEELLESGKPQTEPTTFRSKHSAVRQDTLSYELLNRLGLISRHLRKNAAGKTRTLSFRDVSHLNIAPQEKILRRNSPLLSGQHTSVTVEYAVFKLLLTGIDDSALITASEKTTRREQDAGKLELLDQLIEEHESDINEGGLNKEELIDQLDRLDEAIHVQNEILLNAQRALDTVLDKRAAIAKKVRDCNARITELKGLDARFRLLNDHYKIDLERLAAIYETGTLFVHLEQQACPLCGADPHNQHLEAQCDGNTEAIVKAAEAEIIKVERLKRELFHTIESMNIEERELEKELINFKYEYTACEQELNDIATPTVSTQRASYNKAVSERGEVRWHLEKFEQLDRLTVKRAEVSREQLYEGGKPTAPRSQISKDALEDFAKTIEEILRDWDFPNAERVFFDEAAKDIQIAGKPRGSTGQGLRAITHAAMKFALMEYCTERNLPHPGFIILDSPLLAYWRPEGDDDDLSGTNLKERFYKYVLGLQKNCQVIIIENEHPPDFVMSDANVIVFTKNPHQGRYGLFPHF